MTHRRKKEEFFSSRNDVIIYRLFTLCTTDSVTRSGDLLDFGQLLNAFGNT